MQSTPPVVPGLPLVGNMLQFARQRHQFLQAAHKQYGSVFSFKLGRQPVVVLIGPEYHQFFFVETDKLLNIEKPYRNLAALFGKVAFLAPPDVYQEQKPILYAPFRPEKMQHYVTIMQREIQRWLDSLGDSGEIDLTAEMSKLVQDVAGNTLMGEDFQRKAGREFWDLYAALGKALNTVLPPDWPLPKNIRRDRAKKRMSEILQPIIAERRKHPERYDDFLQDFVNTRCRSGAEADDETIISLIRGLLFASHETTAGQAAWTIIEILRHPEYAALVQQEIATHAPVDVPIDGKLLRRLEHIFYAVREIERMHPSANMLMRMTNEEIEIGGYRIPKGWLVMTAAGLAHRSPELFAEPDRFDPLRFAPGRAEDRQHGYALIGFGGGKHKCAGMNFANNEMIVITLMLFQQFDLELVTKNPQTNYGLGAGRPEATIVRYRRKHAVEAQPEPEVVSAV
ncbi:MAG TPA: cytochrome P450 [Herpetosiphonaceae bacterium]